MKPYGLVVLVAIVVGYLSLSFQSLWIVFVGPAFLVWLALVRTAVGRLPIWATVSLVPLTGYVILNYGFANWAVRAGGFALPIGYLLAAASLAMMIYSRGWRMGGFLREPALVAWLLLLSLSVAHLAVNIPRYGSYAVRDANFVLEGVFILLGLAWASQRAVRHRFLAALALLFILNFLYSLTYLLRGDLLDISPISGVYRSVPIFGFYANQALILLAGSLYFFLVRGTLGMPRSLELGLSIAQALWSFVFQERSMYVGLLVALVVLAVLAGPGRTAKIAGALGVSFVVLLWGVSLIGLEVPGRVGNVSPRFLLDHTRSIFLAPDTPGRGSAQWRVDLYPDAIRRWYGRTSTMLVGEGFGRPLIQFELAGGVLVRQPHNTHLSVLMRLGLIGLVLWVALHGLIVSRLLAGARRERRWATPTKFDTWLLAFYVLAMVMTTVQPWLEFSYGAVPFYILMGYGIGLSRSWSKSRAASNAGGPGETIPPKSSFARA